MKAPRIYWEGIANAPRDQVLQQIKRSIQIAGGTITHSHFFSDISVGLTIELLSQEMELLRQILEKTVSLKSDAQIATTFPDSTEIALMLNITFSDGTGNLRNEIPMVPG